MSIKKKPVVSKDQLFEIENTFIYCFIKLKNSTLNVLHFKNYIGYYFFEKCKSIFKKVVLFAYENWANTFSLTVVVRLFIFPSSTTRALRPDRRSSKCDVTFVIETRFMSKIYQRKKENGYQIIKKKFPLLTKLFKD